MSSNIISLPFRRTHPVKLSSAIEQYISAKYDQHPKMFAQDLEAIDRLRVEAVSSMEVHSSAIRKLTSYAAQLVYVGGKFPIDIGVEFTWYPALGFNTQRPISQDNLRFELANVLYNIASLYTQLAVSSNRTTGEGLKAACNYFSQAAGVIAHLKDKIIPDLRTAPPEDMDMMTLESVQHLLLAQGQECFWSKAVKDNMKDGTIAKLAAKVSDFYDEAANFGTKSDIISTEWIHHMNAKHHHFAAAAQYRASRECLEKQEYGEEVARLRDSLVCVSEALKEARWINKIVLGDLHSLKERVMEDLRRAEKDNDVIYLMSVPAKSELKTLGRAGMATARVPEAVADPVASLEQRDGAYGQPLFSKLVPYAVHVAASIYEERKERLVKRSIIDEIDALNTQMSDLLQSLNLPGSLQALERPLGIPPSILSRAEEIKQQDGLHRLRRSMYETSKMKENDVASFEQGLSSLRAEAAEDDLLRAKHGTQRWTRPSSVQAAEKLYSQVKELDGYLKSASNSDDLVKTKLKEHEKVIQVLEGTSRDMEEFVPSSRRATMTPDITITATNLRHLLNDVGQVESRRRRQITKVREKAKGDDINKVILVETARLEREYPMQRIEPAQFEDLFETRLERYDEDVKAIDSERASQMELSAQLKEANYAFTNARKGDTSSRERERALQQLDNGYIKYKEIINNINTGREFYNKLASIMARFRDECRVFAHQRRMEASSLQEDLENAMSALSLGQNGLLQDQRQKDVMRSHYTERAPVAEPLVAPVATRPKGPATPTPGMWKPEIGIQFAPPSAQSLPQQGQNVHNPTYPATVNRGGPWDVNQGVRFG